MALRASYYGLKKKILDKVLGDYDASGVMTNRELTAKIGFYKELRIGAVSFNNNALSNPVEIVYDTPFSGSFESQDDFILILNFQGGNDNYIYVYTVAGVFAARCSVLLKNITNNTQDSVRKANYIAIKLK